MLREERGSQSQKIENSVCGYLVVPWRLWKPAGDRRLLLTVIIPFFCEAERELLGIAMVKSEEWGKGDYLVCVAEDQYFGR